MGFPGDLKQILGAVEILSETRFRVGERLCEVGRTAPLFSPSLAGGPPPAGPEEALIRAVTEELYSCWYTRAGAASPPRPDPRAHHEHLARLSAANTSRGTWEPGWLLRGVDAAGGLTVEGGGVLFQAAPAEVRPSGGRLEPGAPCRVRIPGEMRSLRPGYYSACGEADLAEPGSTAWLLRCYWHLAPRGAPAWVGALTAGLNRRRVPFRLKVVGDPRFYLRADAGVLFLEPEHYRVARPVIRRAYREVRGALRPTVPGFTFELAPGLSLAEGPAKGESFGGHRCGLVARAVVAAANEAASPRAKHEAVSESFRAAGLDPQHPYRAPGSASRYRSLPRSELGAPTADAPPSAPPAKRPTLVEAATAIGDALCRSAHRQDKRCNWIGRTLAADPGGDFVPAVAALGPDLYGGTAGIAVFLAELSAVTGDSGHRRTALAAQRQALQSLRSDPHRCRPVAFFEGQLGVAWAARRVAALADGPELAEEADRLVAAIVRDLPGEHRLDVLEGNAGAILALLRLDEQGAAPGCLEAAVDLGKELLRAAGASAKGVVAAGPQPLTGFAHGAAGVGLALLELCAVTGDPEVRQAADAQFAWEDASFDAARRNWPDFRDLAADDRPAAPPGFMTAWCHGAAGVALSRLRAAQVDPGRAEAYLPAARAGLATTLERIDGALAEPESDEGLCHGIGGLADVALIGGRALGDGEPSRRALDAMERLAGRRSGRSPSTPISPSLFLGEAGIGYAMLRLDGPERVPTVLLPGASA